MSQYIITDGSRFIYQNHSGKFVPTSSEAMADVYTKKQAEGIFKKLDRRTYRPRVRTDLFDL